MCGPGHIRFIKLALFLVVLMMQVKSNNLCAQFRCDKTVVSFTNQKLSEILDSLSNRFGVNFSYNSDLSAIKKEKSIQDEVLVNWWAFFAWIIGVILYYKLLKFDMIVGTTVPVMILTAILYFICGRWFSKWKFVKKFQN